MNAATFATLARSAALGGIAGLRTLTPAFALSSKGARIPLGTLALSELAGDKFVSISRLAPPALIARFVAGAVAGAALSGRRSGSRTAGAIAGSTGALAGAWLGYHLRRALVTRAGLPDKLVGLCEDAVAAGGAFALTR